MFMGRTSSTNLYKHGISRRYLNLGDDGRAYRYVERGRFEEIPFEAALAWVAEPLAEMGETLETPYDEESTRRGGQRPCGRPVVRICAAANQPEKVAVD